MLRGHWAGGSPTTGSASAGRRSEVASRQDYPVSLVPRLDSPFTGHIRKGRAGWLRTGCDRAARGSLRVIHVGHSELRFDLVVDDQHHETNDNSLNADPSQVVVASLITPRHDSAVRHQLNRGLALVNRDLGLRTGEILLGIDARFDPRACGWRSGHGSH